MWRWTSPRMEEKSRRWTSTGEERKGKAEKDGGEESDGGDEVRGEAVQQLDHGDCVKGRLWGGGRREKRRDEKPQ